MELVSRRTEDEGCHSEPKQSEGEESRNVKTLHEILRPLASE